MTNPKISIIIPAYNIEGYISACLDSVLSQTYSNLELIVVDDGSSDRTSIILDDYSNRDNRIRLIHQENQGVTAARLRGIIEATGEWVGFVDGDDFVEPRMFEHLLKNAVEYKADISHCGYQMVFPDRVDYYNNTGELRVQETQTALVGLMNGSIEPGLWNKLFIKRLFAPILSDNLIDTTIRINEDLLMNFFLFRGATVSVFEDICPYHYQIRRNSAATSKINSSKLRDPIKVRRILLAETEKDTILHPICMSQYVRALIRTATRAYHQKDDIINQCIQEARRELRVRQREIWTMQDVSLLLKMLAGWASFSPNSYRAVHTFYGEITGSRHKYDIHD